MPTQPTVNYSLTGRISDQQGDSLSGLTVRAYRHQAQGRPVLLGEATTNEEGRYSIRYEWTPPESRSDETAGPDVFIIVLAGDEQVGRSPLRRNVGQRVSISLRMELPAPSDLEEPEEPEEPAFSVSGVVLQSDGRPLAGVVVRAFDQGLRERRTELGQSNTGADGRYVIAYSQDKLLDPQRGSANLVVEVVGRDGVVLAGSDVHFNARRNEIINLTADPDGQASEWERLMAHLRPALQEVALSDLTDEDLAFIARSRRLDPKQLQPMVAAARTAAESRLPVWFHYALIRQGLPSGWKDLLGTSRERITQAVSAAQKANIIAPNDRELAAAQQQLITLQVENVLDHPLAGHRMEARKLFRLAKLDGDQQQSLARALAGQQGRELDGSVVLPPDSGLDEEGLQRVRVTLRLARLVNDNEGAVRALVDDGRIQGLRDLARHYDLQTWKQLLERTTGRDGADLPDELPGETIEEKRAVYARQLHAQVTVAYPNLAVAYGLARQPAFARNRAIQILPRITEEDRGFDLTSARLDKYVAERGEALGLRTEEDIADTINELKRVQRLYRLKPDTALLTRLLEENLDSAMAIAHRGKRNFVESIGADPSVGRGTALAVYREAERTAARAFGTYAHFNPGINTSPTPVAIEKCPVALKGVPDIATLFGTLDGCECEPCESVYSPAAYLTDLLAFLERNIERDPAFDRPDLVPSDGLTGLNVRSYCNAADELRRDQTRRPDIVQTLLSCRNAETEMPYIDLVLEILERAVAPEDSSSVYQTGLPTEQLGAHPEHFNARAYEQLARAVFPFSLPFDLWHEETDRYLDRMGTSRAELLETFFPFQVEDGIEAHDLTDIRRWQDTEIAKAHLGLSDNQWQVIANTTTTNAAVETAWGYASEQNWWHPLRNAHTFLTRAALEYKDLLRLLRLRSFNPTGNIRLSEASLSLCDPNEITLDGLNDAALGFLHRFLGLQRALDWSLREVGQALLALSPPTSSTARPALDEAFLVRLSHLVRLRERFSLPLDELLAWWAPLDTRDYSVPELPRELVSPSLYERLFLIGRPLDGEFAVFRLNDARTELQDASLSLNTKLPLLAGALRLPQPDLKSLIDSLFTESSQSLNLAAISLVFRHVSLARALNFSIEDYLKLKKLVGFDPFMDEQLSASESLGGTLQTLRFVERAMAVKDSDFSVAELDYLLRQTIPFTGKTVAPTAEWAEQSLQTLQESLLDLTNTLPAPALLDDILNQLPSEGDAPIDPAALRTALITALDAFTAFDGEVTIPLDDIILVLQQSLVAVPGDGAMDDTAWASLGAAVDEYQAIFAQHEALLQQLRQEALQIALSEILNVPPAVCKVLLEWTRLPADSSLRAVDALLAAFLATEPDQADQTSLTELLYRLHKAALAIDRLGIHAYELIDAMGEQPRFLKLFQISGWLDLRLPVRDTDSPEPYDAWMRTVRLFQFRDALLPEQQEHLFDLFSIAVGYSADGTPFAGEQRRDYFGKLALLSGWSEDDLRALIGLFDIGELSEGGGGILRAAFPMHFVDERLPHRILTAIQLLKQLGITAFTAKDWIAPVPAGRSPQHRVDQIKSALEARYGSGWNEILKTLRDPLREQQRQALVTYLLHEWNLERADDLSDHFLIDVEMSACMMTSRLIQATAAVQMFVQRVVMNLEPGLVLSDEGAEQWEWMKNYRVWEANRKVFLYPENWIEPELRDDKTPFFKDLENELMQADITNDTAETALIHYLEKLHEVARLQICGQYLDWTGDNRVTLHVFARTRDMPHRYYYRRGLLELDREALMVSAVRDHTSSNVGSASTLENSLDAHWTPWEQVDVDIEGDQLIPIVYNRRVYLFWPVYTSEDEAPFTHLTQQAMQLFRQLLEIQIKLGDLIRGMFQGIGVAVIAGLANGIIQLIDSLPDMGFSQETKNSVRKIRKNLLPVVGINESWDVPLNPQGTYDTRLDMKKRAFDDTNKIFTELSATINFSQLTSIFQEFGVLVGSLEGHLIKLLPAKRLEVQLAWSEFKGDSWTAKKTSAEVVSFRDVVSTFFESLPELPGLGNQGVKRLFTFRGSVEKTTNRLSIECFVALPKKPTNNQTEGSDLWSLWESALEGKWLSVPKLIGTFSLNGCNGTLEAEDEPEDFGLLALLSEGISQFLGTIEDTTEEMLKDLVKDRQLSQRGVPMTPDDDSKRPSFLRFVMQNGSDIGLGPIPARSAEKDGYRILARHQDEGDFSKLIGFFYQDLKRVFFCLPWLHEGDPYPGKPREIGYLFFPFYHPYTCALLEQLQRAGVHGVYQDRYVKLGNRIQLPSPGEAGDSLQMLLIDESFFGQEYSPNAVQHSNRALRPIEEFNFSTIGAYSQYNWEIFFHVPLLIANRLSTNQKFREAQHWFHYIFNPTDASRGSVPEKYWRTKPFVERSQTEYYVQDIDPLLLILNDEAAIGGLQEIEWAVKRWREDAFNPHLVARTRTVAFQKAVVMKYIDNLIAWADSLFRRETREAVNEALQLYILAAKLLGPRPRRIPKSQARPERSFQQLQEDLDAFSNALVEYENYLQPNAAVPSMSSMSGFHAVQQGKNKLAGSTLAPVANGFLELIRSPSLRDVSRKPGEKSLYFCVPANHKLLDKWDVVSDRLFKIRYCQNIEGQALSLALLSPPIDPALLVRARAMGMNVDSVLGQLQAPLPHYRFQVLSQKATELCGEVKALGSALLSALEKRDGEELALLRNTHELRLFNAVQAIKEEQIKEAKCGLEGLQHSKEATEIRRDHNLRLLMEFISPEEIASSVLGAASLLMQVAQVGAKFGAAAGGLVPNIKGGFVTTLGAMFGGQQIGDSAERAADAFGHIGSILSSTSGLISTMGSYRRRAEDWLLQITLAEKELEGLEKQICAAEIRVAVAEADLENHKLQIRNSQEAQDFMQKKFTSQELYDWMVSQTASLYFQSYQLAYDTARKAERAFAFELDLELPTMISYGYWDSLKKGLLAGDHLHHDLKRLEVAYLDKNRRELELTKNVSLTALDPLELIKLRETGRMEFSLPEALFDMDFPGHYMRRIKSVSLSIPCVTGPYGGVFATLRLEKSRIRCKPDVNGGYPPINDDDQRFQIQRSATRVMATSSGQNDSGLFELNFRDERYLPFEGEGMESRWSLSINKEFAQFDLDTISDVILHVRYTARDGGEALRTAALDSLRAIQDELATIDDKQPLPLTRVFSVRHEFPNAWARFQAQTPADGELFELTLDLRREHYPFWSQGRLKNVEGIEILARSTESTIELGNSALTQNPAFGELHHGQMVEDDLPNSPIGKLVLAFNTAALSDLWVAVAWST